ncbi:MAG TPA: cytochrome c [Rhizomicrobium sp.]
MRRWFVWAGVAVVAAIAAFYVRPVYVWLRSEAVLDRRYTLPRSLVRADLNAKAVARGARLVRLAGCTGCHGPDLTGKPLRDPVAIFASNLPVLTAATYSDEDFDRAIRRGLRPDASSLWVMPSFAYVYVRDADIAAILGYLRALKPQGAQTPLPAFDHAAREKIARAELQPEAELAQTQMPAVSLGPHYDGGRYIAMWSCGPCHGTELIGIGVAPDLRVVTRYSRHTFFNLMRRGWGAKKRRLKVMGPLASQRFHILADWEIDPLYEYLTARARAPKHVAVPAATR